MLQLGSRPRHQWERETDFRGVATHLLSASRGSARSTASLTRRGEPVVGKPRDAGAAPDIARRPDWAPRAARENRRLEAGLGEPGSEIAAAELEPAGPGLEAATGIGAAGSRS